MITATSGNHSSAALGLAIYGLSEIASPLDLGVTSGATASFLFASGQGREQGNTDLGNTCAVMAFSRLFGELAPGGARAAVPGLG